MTDDISFILIVVGVITDIPPSMVNIDLYYTIIIGGWGESIAIQMCSTKTNLTSSVINSDWIILVNQFGIHTCLLLTMTHVMVLLIPVH